MQVYEKYVNLARDAFSSGDRIAAESYQQYAEHYFRIINDTTDPQRPSQERPAAERPEAERPETERPEAERPETERPEAEQASGEQPGQERQKSGRQPYPVNAEQPFVVGDGIAPAAEGNGQASEAKPKPRESAAPPTADGQADGQADGEPPAEKKAKPRGRGRPRTRAKAGNGAAAEGEAEEKATAEPCQPGKAGETSS